MVDAQARDFLPAHAKRREVGFLLLAFVLTRLLIVAAGLASIEVRGMEERADFTHLLDGGAALDMWYRWDAGFYTTIAIEGYDWQNERAPTADMAFMPVYPLLVRLASGISGQSCAVSPYLSTCATVGGLIVSNLALFGAIALTFDLASRRFNKGVGWRAAFLLMVSPISIFLSGVYTESVFLLLTALTFWLIERDRVGFALIPATFAALTRSVGVALYPALLIVAWRTYRQSPAMITRPRLKGLLIALGAHLPLIAFGAYILYMGITTGDPLAFFSSYENAWGRTAGSIVESFTIYFSGADVSLIGWHPSWFDLIFTVLALILTVITLRVDGGWGIFALFALIIPIASGTLVGMPRFAMTILPFYIIVARLIGDRRSLWWAIAYGASAALAILILSQFVTWRWVA